LPPEPDKDKSPPAIGPITSANSPLIALIVASSSRVLAIESAMSRAVFRVGSVNAFSSSVRSRFSASACSIIWRALVKSGRIFSARSLSKDIRNSFIARSSANLAATYRNCGISAVNQRSTKGVDSLGRRRTGWAGLITQTDPCTAGLPSRPVIATFLLALASQNGQDDVAITHPEPAG
jgi:hypothetical protein